MPISSSTYRPSSDHPPLRRKPASIGSSHHALSFRSFVKRNPDPHADIFKPLPPTPSDAELGRITSLREQRSAKRSGPASSILHPPSSIYSQSVNGSGASYTKWKCSDSPGNLAPTLESLASLQALAYSSSSPGLVESRTSSKDEVGNIRDNAIARVGYRRSSSTPSPRDQMSILLPAPPVAPRIPYDRLATVLLSRGDADGDGTSAYFKQANQSNTLRSQSSRFETISNIDSLSQAANEKSITQSTLVDNRTRRRSIRSPRSTVSRLIEEYYAAPGPSTENATELSVEKDSGQGEQSKLMPPRGQDEKWDKVGKLPRIFQVDQPRGRPRNRGDIQYGRSRTSAGSFAVPATDYAQQYRALIDERDRLSTPDLNASGTTNSSSDGSSTIRRKMVPLPLFTNDEQRGSSQRTMLVNRSTDQDWESHYRLSHTASHDRDIGRTRHGRPSSMEVNLSTSSLSSRGYRRSSTSGSIPISPPASSLSNQESAEFTIIRQGPTRLVSRSTVEPKPRTSAFYPHVTSRRARKVSTKRNDNVASAPPVSLKTNQQKQRIPSETISRRNSDTSHTEPSKRRLDLTRTASAGVRSIANSAAKHTEGLRKSMSARVSHASRILPSPSKHRSKSTHTEPTPTISRARSAQPYTTTSRHRIIHNIGLDRPLHERPAAPRDENNEPRNATNTNSGAPSRRRNSLIDAFFDTRRENKAEKRREELRRVIKLVPNSEVMSGGSSAVGSRRPGLVERAEWQKRANTLHRA